MKCVAHSPQSRTNDRAYDKIVRDVVSGPVIDRLRWRRGIAARRAVFPPFVFAGHRSSTR
jgi:hypothetical protein